MDDINKPGRKQNLNPMWKKFMKHVDLGEPTSFLDHVYLGCTQRECKSNKSILEDCKEMFELRISAGATEKLFGWEKSHTKTVAWSCDLEGHPVFFTGSCPFCDFSRQFVYGPWNVGVFQSRPKRSISRRFESIFKKFSTGSNFFLFLN